MQKKTNESANTMKNFLDSFRNDLVDLSNQFSLINRDNPVLPPAHSTKFKFGALSQLSCTVDQNIISLCGLTPQHSGKYFLPADSDVVRSISSSSVPSKHSLYVYGVDQKYDALTFSALRTALEEIRLICLNIKDRLNVLFANTQSPTLLYCYNIFSRNGLGNEFAFHSDFSIVGFTTEPYLNTVIPLFNRDFTSENMIAFIPTMDCSKIELINTQQRYDLAGIKLNGSLMYNGLTYLYTNHVRPPIDCTLVMASHPRIRVALAEKMSWSNTTINSYVQSLENVLEMLQ